MMPLCSINSLQMALTATVYIICVFSTCSTKECRLHMTEKMKDRSTTFGTIDIKFCQLYCQESFIFASCRKSKNIGTGGFSVRPQNHPHVLTKPSASKVCNRASQSLESGSGKAVGVQASRDPSQDPRQSKSVLGFPVTTQELASRVTPSPANCHDLYIASRDGKIMEVKRILSTGNVNINCGAGRYCKTPVMWAAYGGHREVLELLINFGADLSVFDSGDSNLLFWACLGGHVKMVEFILSLGAVDINALNMGGWTAVGWARGQGHQRVVDLMLSHGAH